MTAPQISSRDLSAQQAIDDVIDRGWRVAAAPVAIFTSADDRERFIAKLARSQEEIAHLAGMNVSNFGKTERGLGHRNFHTLVRIASVLGVDPAVLVAKIGADALPDMAETCTAADFVREHHRGEHNG